MTVQEAIEILNTFNPDKPFLVEHEGDVYTLKEPNLKGLRWPSDNKEIYQTITLELFS